ncbi:glycosyltransferase family 2 protein [Gephyromycinifex aptenodytis]|uniref:glycosyltransferase family 2 protein n=1 Tax=Gephyromycinifex aptenodytis TaxID=2716227 RepID=UPI001445B085|nr:glycosyltransferase family 2 protein [Gephyromycinifex aptenodytis]
MHDELISVLMPVLNEEASVLGAIRSALSQERVNVEVLVIDGRSSDRTRAVVQELAAQEPRVRLLDNPKVIIPAALNVGLAAARGQYVARIDGHASVSSDYLARALEHLRADAQLAAVGGIREGVGRTPTGRAVALALSSPFGVGDSVNHFGTEFCLTDHASFGVYRAEVARAVNGWDENLLVNEDVDFDHRILGLGHHIAFDPAMHIYWHVRESVPDLFRQYRRYGRGKAGMVRKNGRAAIRARHLAAPVAVVGTAALALGSVKFPRLAAAAYSPYLFGVGAATAKAVREDTSGERLNVAALPGAFAAMHYGWGLGFLEGILLGRTPARASGSGQSLPNG